MTVPFEREFELYHFGESICSQKARVGMLEKDVPYASHHIGLCGFSAGCDNLAPEYVRVNPRGQVPTLVLPDGSIMSETAAILIHLAACHPDKGLGPGPGTAAHGQFLRWLVFANVNVYEAVLRRSYPFRYTTDQDALDATRDAAIARMGEALAVLEQAVESGPFLFGDAMTVADVYIAMLFIWFRGETEAPKLTRLTAGVRQHPTVAPIWRRHFGDR